MEMRITILFIFLAATLDAQEWPRFRGVGGAGTGAGPMVPATFAIEDANWRVKLSGEGHSSPVLWEDRIFLTGVSGAEGRRWISCLSTKDGSVLWEKELSFEPHRQHRFNSFASSTPAVDEERVYVVWSSGSELVATALNHAGKEVWRKTLGKFQAQHGSGSSPVVVGGVVVMGNDNEGEESFLIGLDAKTGKARWRRKRKSSESGSYATPIVRRSGATAEVIFASTSYGLTSLDPATGRLVWETGPVLRKRCVGCPAIADGVLFASSGTGGGGKDCVAVELPKGGSSKPRELYRLRKALPYVPSPIGVGSRFFLLSDGGVASWIEARTGKVLWRERLDGSFYSSPVCIEKRLYCLSRAGRLFVVAAKDSFQLLGSVDLGEPTSATPAVSGGVLYLRTLRHLISVGGGQASGGR